MKTESSATVFNVSKSDHSKKFYQEVLGFEVDFVFGNYVGLKYGDVYIHLNEAEPDDKNIGSGSIYIFCDEVENYYHEIVSRGSETTGEPVKSPYDMFDFQAIDPDGNILCFGCPVSE